ncbi:MAG: hypothetical protein FJ265_09010, partial [Planctomycetes bacterium]|nr:hypothetical protein [Planctomycetota bacterium]
MRTISHAWRTACLLSLLGSAASAQDLVDLPWDLSPEGRLLVQILPSDERTWTPMFAGLLDGATGHLAQRVEELWQCGPFLALPLVLTGDGGAAAIDEYELRLRKLGIRMGLRRDLMGPARGEPFADLLRVRWLADLDVAFAGYRLAQWAREEGEDPFVRAAAAAGASRWSGLGDELGEVRAKRNGEAALQAGLQQLPDDFDLLLGLHSAGLPTARDLLRAWRQFQLRFASMVLFMEGGSVSPAQ